MVDSRRVAFSRLAEMEFPDGTPLEVRRRRTHATLPDEWVRDCLYRYSCLRQDGEGRERVFWACYHQTTNMRVYVLPEDARMFQAPGRRPAPKAAPGRPPRRPRREGCSPARSEGSCSGGSTTSYGSGSRSRSPRTPPPRRQGSVCGSLCSLTASDEEQISTRTRRYMPTGCQPTHGGAPLTHTAQHFP